MEIYKKLFKVKNSVGKISKDASNPFAKSKYVSLSKINEVINPLLEANGLYLDFQTELDIGFQTSRVKFEKIHDNSANFVEALKTDISQCYYNLIVTITDIDNGEQVVKRYDRIPHDLTQNNPTQGFGATMTYAQRYAYAMLFGLSFGNDDPDANDPKGKSENIKKVSISPKPKKEILIDTEGFNKSAEWLNTGSNSIEKLKKNFTFTKEVEAALIAFATDLQTSKK